MVCTMRRIIIFETQNKRSLIKMPELFGMTAGLIISVHIALTTGAASIVVTQPRLTATVTFE